MIALGSHGYPDPMRLNNKIDEINYSLNADEDTLVKARALFDKIDAFMKANP